MADSTTLPGKSDANIRLKIGSSTASPRKKKARKKALPKTPKSEGKTPAGSPAGDPAKDQIDRIFAEVDEADIQEPTPDVGAPVPVPEATAPEATGETGPPQATLDPQLDNQGPPQVDPDVAPAPVQPEASVAVQPEPSAEAPTDTPDEQIDRIFAEIEQEDSAEKQIQQIADENFEEIEKARARDKFRGVYSTFMKALDTPIDLLTAGPDGAFVREGTGFYAGDKLKEFIRGEAPTDDAEDPKRRHPGFFETLATELGILQEPEEREKVFGDRGEPEVTEEFAEGEYLGLNSLIVIGSPLLRALEVIAGPQVAPGQNPFSPFVRDKILTFTDKLRNYLASVGEVGVKAPATSAIIETVAAKLAAQGDKIARRDFPDSAAARFVFPVGMAAGGTFLMARTAFGFLRQGASAYSNAFGASSVELNAAEIVQTYKTGTNENAIKNLLNPELFHPSVRAQFNVSEITLDEGIIGMRAVFYTAKDAEKFGAIKRWQELKAMIVELSSVPRSTVNMTEKTIKESIEGQAYIMKERMEIIREALKAEVLRQGPGMTERAANQFAFGLLFDENQIVLATNKQRWVLVDKELPLPTGAPRKALEGVMRKIITEEGTPEGLLELVKVGKGTENDLFKFIGSMKFIKPEVPTKGGINEALGGTPRYYNPEGRWEFVPGDWGKGEVSLKQIQALRSRVLETIRAEQKKDSPRLRRITLLYEVEEGLIHALGAADARSFGAGPTLAKQIYLEALAHTRQMKTDWSKGAAYDVLNTGRRGEAPTAELALSKITAGAGKRSGADIGASTIEELLRVIRPNAADTASEALRRSESAERLKGAMEDALKGGLEAAAVRGGRYDIKKAEDWMLNNRRILDLEDFRFIRDDIERSLQAEDALALKERIVTGLTTRMKTSTDLSVAALYATKSPSAAFEEIMSKSDDKLIDRLTRDLVLRWAKDPSGRARAGGESAFYYWLMESGFQKKINSLTGPEALSGLAMRDKWDRPATQRMAKILLDKSQYDHVEKTINGLTALEFAQKTSAIRETLDIQPNNMVVNFLRWSALRFSPISKGPGQLMISKHLSTGVQKFVTDRHKDPIVDHLMRAFSDKDPKLLFALLADINKKGNAAIVARQINAFIATSAFEAGEVSINEDALAPQELQ